MSSRLFFLNHTFFSPFVVLDCRQQRSSWHVRNPRTSARSTGATCVCRLHTWRQVKKKRSISWNHIHAILRTFKNTDLCMKNWSRQAHRSHPASFAQGIKWVSKKKWSVKWWCLWGRKGFSFSLHFTPLINLRANPTTVCGCEEMLSFVIFVLRGTCGEWGRREGRAT